MPSDRSVILAGEAPELGPDTPVYDGDFWSDEVILNPYPTYRELQELGPVVWLSRQRCWAATHYDSVKQVLLTPAVFSSASGCMMNDAMNTASQGVMLCSDDPEHMALRRLFAKPLLPKSLAQHRPLFERLASERVSALVQRDRFDAVSELAHHLPLSVVTELVGLDDGGKQHMLEWAAGVFDAFGPEDSSRTHSGLAIAEQAIAYAMGVERSRLAADGWGAALFDAADAGTISEQTARIMLIDYLSPALDTTINASSAAIELFAYNPDQWALLRERPELVPNAINEVVRMESPIRAFSRFVTQDYEIGGVCVRAGDRILPLYACANRDPRRYPDPARFDISRGTADHMGFGQGTHMCAGMHLARLEITVLLQALIAGVSGFVVHEAERRPHNTLRGLHRLTTTLVA